MELTTSRNTKRNECKIVIRFKWSFWAIKPQFREVGRSCSDVQRKHAEDSVEDFIEETTDQVEFAFKSANTTNSFYFFSW